MQMSAWRIGQVGVHDAETEILPLLVTRCREIPAISPSFLNVLAGGLTKKRGTIGKREGGNRRKVSVFIRFEITRDSSSLSTPFALRVSNLAELSRFWRRILPVSTRSTVCHFALFPGVDGGSTMKVTKSAQQVSRK